MTRPRPKITAVLIAFNAAGTLEEFYRSFPRHLVDDIILIDDASRDGTYELAQELGIRSWRNPVNLGYGGNLKRILASALRDGADILIDIHPDGEYDTSAIPDALARIEAGAEFVLGNRFTDPLLPLRCGMYPWKWVFITTLNWFHKHLLGAPVDDLHQGFRVYSRSMLERISFEENSNGYLFSFEVICQALMAGVRLEQVPVRTRYTGDKRGATLKNSVMYSLGTFKVACLYLLGRLGLPIGLFKRPHRSMDARVSEMLK